MSGPTFPCDDCGKVFGGYRGFRDHRPGGRCLTARQLRKRGLHLNAVGAWVRRDPTNTQAVLFPKPRTPVTSESTLAGVDPRGRVMRSGIASGAEKAS